MTAESPLQADIRLAIGKVAHARLFRNSVGGGWVGEVLDNSKLSVTLRQARYVTFGLQVGSGDLIGWTTVTITPEMVGHRIAVFTSGEVKPLVARPRKDQEHQERWRATVEAAGGFAEVLRSVEDGLKLVRAG